MHYVINNNPRSQRTNKDATRWAHIASYFYEMIGLLSEVGPITVK